MDAPVMNAAEATKRQLWVKQHLDAEGPTVPFSFLYDGTPASSLLNDWKRTDTREVLDAARLNLL